MEKARSRVADVARLPLRGSVNNENRPVDKGRRWMILTVQSASVMVGV
jgi:hypothetical protein